MASIDSLSIRISASTTDAQKKVDALVKSLEALVGAIDKLDVSKFETLSQTMNDLSQSFQGLKGAGVKQIEKAAKALKNIESQKESFEPIKKGAEEVSQATQKISENADKVKEGFSSIDSSSIDGMASSMQKASSILDKTTYKMSAFKELLAKTKIIIPTEGLEKVNKKVERLSEKIADLKDKMNFKSQTQAGYVNSEEMEKDQEKIASLINELDRLKLKKQELESHGGFKLNAKSWGFSDIHNGLKNLNKQIDKFISKMFKARSAAHDTAKSTRSFDDAAKRLTKSLTKVTKMLKLMITRMALRTVIKETGNGFKSLALHSEEFDNAMSGIINSSKKLAYSFAAMVSPLINALAPALTYIIGLLTKFLNIINQIFSAIGGKTTYSKAKDFTGKWSDDIEAANKGAKELKKTVLGFDELNQLTDKHTSGGDTSNNIEDMFDDVAIEAKFQDLAKKIKNILNKLLDPLKKAWAAVGKEVVAAWSGAFKSLKKLFADIGRDFLKVWNEPRTLTMLKTILRIFKDIGGTVKYLADALDKAWNTNDLGLKILRNIRDIFLVILTHIRNMTYATMMWAKELNFTPLLEAFNDWLTSMRPVIDGIAGAFEDFYTQVLLPLGKWSIEEGLPELIKVFTDFNEKVRWNELREKLSDLWTHLEPFAKKVGEGLIQFIRDCANALADFINSDTFQDFLDKIKDWMDNVDAEDVARTLKLVAGAIITLKGALFLLEGIKGLTTLVTTLKAFFGLFAAEGAASGAAAAIGEAAEAVGGLTGALEGLEGALTAGATAAFIEQLSQFRKQSQINEMSDDLMKGKVSVEEYNKAVSEIKWGKIAEDGYSFKQALIDFINPFSDTDVIGSLREMNNQLGIHGDHMHANAQQIEEYGKKMGWTAEEIKKYTDSLGAANENSTKLPANLKSLGGAMTILQRDVKNSTDEIKKSADVITINIPNDVANAELEMSGSWQTLSKNTSSSMTEIQTSVQSSMDEVNKSFDTVKEGMSEDKWTFSGVWEGLKKTFEKAKEAIKGVWNSIADKLNGQHKIFGSTVDIDLPRFAAGGFPEDGLFMANHNEMVGKFSNGKTAVANNEQITAGIAQAVYSAMMSANGGGGSVPVYTTIQIGEEQIARAVTKGQRRMDRRYSPTMA